MDNTAGRRRSRGWGVLGFILILAAAAAAGLFYIGSAMKPPASTSSAVRISYPPGTSTAQLAEELETKGLIRDSRIFTLYLRLKGEGGRFQAGEYEWSPGASAEEIIAKLNSGETVKEAGLRLTVPEGFTVLQIAQKLAEQEAVKADALLAAADSYIPAGKTEGMPPLPAADSKLRHRLEGYLFPETYEWKKDAKPQEIVDTMVRELGRRLKDLPDGWQDAMKQRNLTFHEVLTIASLIEREVVVDEERKIVSGVIQNRLEQGMPLQIDATVQYLLDKPKERLLHKDLEVVSPYNTYLNKGLPPGPIASPSLASIEAALYPEKTAYLFYVTKKDGTMGHLFAETFEQHKKNIAESNKAGNP
ncbi:MULTISPECIES: endolytic transglycosylase MltG [Paenibacillus]|uniref:endolytic transglycosylase MltG n=1 Tax=Paenibacillus TaxID=44249 RepID=UPI0022B93524|nr:endolytic transglycosylase MltG [Paenibacillus caseinilyticus]MCZ8519019.1 endolytic transglycosylase MltG [Paenibacillus caseinilyticus]